MEAKRAFVESSGGDVMVSEEHSQWFDVISAIVECGVLAAVVGKNLEGDERMARVMSQWLGKEVDYPLFDSLMSRCVEALRAVGLDVVLSRLGERLHDGWQRTEAFDFACDFSRRRAPMTERQLLVLLLIGEELGFSDEQIRKRIEISQLPKHQRLKRRSVASEHVTSELEAN